MATRRWLPLTLMALVLVLTQGSAAATRSFWTDEVWTVGVVSAPLVEIPARTAENLHPPLYFLLAATWARPVGTGEVGLRALSILWLLAMLLGTYALGARVLGRRAALAAALLFTLSPLVLAYGHTARYYSMGGALALALALSLHGYLRTRRWPYLMGYVLTAVALLYTLYLGALAIGATALVWLVAIVRGRRGAGALTRWVAAHALVVAAFSPWLPTIVAQQAYGMGAPAFGAPLLPAAALRAMMATFAFVAGESLSPLNPLAWLGLALVALAVGHAALARGAERWLLALLALIVAGAALLSAASAYPVSAPQALARRIFFALPLFLLVIAAGAQALRPRLYQAVLGGLVAMSLVGMLNYYADQQFVQPFLTVPWRQTVARVAAEGSPADLVICNLADYRVCAFYVQRAGLTPQPPEAGYALAAEGHATVWWLQTHMAEAYYDTSEEDQWLAALMAGAREVDSRSYGPQDAGIRWLKARLLGQSDYAFRLTVHRIARGPAPSGSP